VPSFFRRSTRNEPFVASPMRDNWYQSSSYYVSSFALITSVAEDGQTSIGPYQLTMPFEVITDRSFMVISRPTSNTVANMKRTRKCALNFVEFDRRQLKAILSLGFPGQDPGEKMLDSCFTLVDSPTPGRESGPVYPKILQEAFQVYECTWEEERGLHRLLREGASMNFLLRIDNILLKESWKKNLENGGKRMPRMPITFGFRGGYKFWFAKPGRAFWLPVPTDKGPKHEAVLYEANRLDGAVRFTPEAADKLTAVPKIFLRTALLGIIKQAKEQGVGVVDAEFVERINRERNG
jgi:flavin reductase (DIM6/NTAB) family NADH-FMN oxidoreductase RutF